MVSQWRRFTLVSLFAPAARRPGRWFRGGVGVGLARGVTGGRVEPVHQRRAQLPLAVALPAFPLPLVHGAICFRGGPEGEVVEDQGEVVDEVQLMDQLLDLRFPEMVVKV